MRRCAHRDRDEYFDQTLSVRTVQRYCSDHCRKTEFRKANKVEAQEGGEDVTLDLVALGLVERPAEVRRRKVAA